MLQQQRTDGACSNEPRVQNGLDILRNSGDFDDPAFIVEWFRGCCNCELQSAGLPTWQQHCPECGHEICSDCPWDPVDIDIKETVFEHQPEEQSRGTHDEFAPYNPTQTSHPIHATAFGSHLSIEQSSSNLDNSQGREKSEKADNRPRKTRRRRLVTKPKTDPQRTFACHFCKRSPQVYNPWAGGDKYLKCLYPKPCDFRHIEDHLKYHKLDCFRCKKCYAKFTDKDDLTQHGKSFVACNLTGLPPIDGIDINQWEKIKVLISTKKNADRSDEDRWFDIWEMLFPGIDRPSTPYSEPPKLDAARFLDEVEYNAELKYETRCLKRDENTHHEWIEIIKQVLNLNIFQDGNAGSQNTLDVPVVRETTNLQQKSCWGDMGHQAQVGNDVHQQLSLGFQSFPVLEASTFGEFDEFVYSDMLMDVSDHKSQALDEDHVFTTPPLPSIARKPSAIQASTTASADFHSLSHDTDLPAQDASTLHWCSDEFPSSQDTNEAQLEPRDRLSTAPDPFLGSHHLTTDPAELFFPLQFPQEVFDSNTHLPSRGEQYGHVIDARLDLDTIEGQLDFESNLPSANMEIKHRQDMNKGLDGRYEFDGTIDI